MKTAVLFAFTLTIFYVSSARAGQTPSSGDIYGNCNSVHPNNSGTITITCNNLDPAVAAELTDVVKQFALLNKKMATEKNQQVTINLLVDMKKSLEAALNQPRIQVNNFRAPGPGPEIKILNQKQVTQEIPAPNSEIYAMKRLPIPPGRKVIVEKITFSVGSSFYQPAFQISCQRACNLIGYECIPTTTGACAYQVGPQPQSADPNIQMFMIAQPLVLTPDVKWVFTVLANDDKAMDYPVITPLIF